MVEFKIQLEERIVESIGGKKIEDDLQLFSQRIILEDAAQNILQDLQENDLENNTEWQLARSIAWKQQQHKYIA